LSDKRANLPRRRQPGELVCSGGAARRPLRDGAGRVHDCKQNCCHDPPARLHPRKPKGPPPTSLQVTGPSLGGGCGIRTPEGFHPTRSPSGLEGWREDADGRVPAGQRASRIRTNRRERLGLAPSCYQNCYQPETAPARETRRTSSHESRARGRGRARLGSAPATSRPTR
jgi:hypothetical protein